MRIWAEYGARIRSINQPTSLISSENQYAIVTQKIGYFAGACAPFWRQGPAKLDAKPQQYYPMVVVGPPLCCWCMDCGGNAITTRPSWCLCTWAGSTYYFLWGNAKSICSQSSRYLRYVAGVLPLTEKRLLTIEDYLGDWIMCEYL